MATKTWGKLYHKRGDPTDSDEQPYPGVIYRPTEYKKDGSVINHSSINGDTLLVVSARVYIKQTLEKNSFKS